MMRRIALVLGLVVCVSGHAEIEAEGCGATTPEIDACIQGKLAKANHLLNDIYGVVIKELAAGTDDPNPLFNSERKRTLILAEREWVKFQNAQCAVEAALTAPGTAVPAVTGQCMIDLIHERIRFLRRVAEQIHWDSKLCKANRASCALPPDSP
jgi:uncharacterized protein YecT (DUF1311 family)